MSDFNFFYFVLRLTRRCVHITDIGVGYISTMLSLSALFLRWCSQVRDFGLQHLCSMRNLQVLSLAGMCTVPRLQSHPLEQMVSQLSMLMRILTLALFQAVHCWPRADCPVSSNCATCRSWSSPIARERHRNSSPTCTNTCHGVRSSSRGAPDTDNKIARALSSSFAPPSPVVASSVKYGGKLLDSIWQEMGHGLAQRSKETDTKTRRKWEQLKLWSPPGTSHRLWDSKGKFNSRLAAVDGGLGGCEREGWR